MKQCAFLILVLSILLLPVALIAQQSPVLNFGEVTAETFAPTVYSIDSAANAVILFDQGVVSFDPASNFYGHSFAYRMEKHTRIRLLRKGGFGLATFTLLTNHKGAVSPSLEDFKGATYNLEDGKVVTTRLDKSNIFKDKSGEFDLEKVVFPNVREGSVIEYSYWIDYPGFQYIPAWTFQGSYPELWSEYDITVPGLYDYAVRHQGYQKYVVDSVIYSSASFPINISGYRGLWSGQTIRRIWALRDVPALEKAEIYTTTLQNHLSKIAFQLSGVHVDGYDKTYRTTWNELTDELLRREDFGGPLSERNKWLDEALKSITAGAGGPQGTAKKIFAYVRDHFDCTNVESLYMSQSLKKVWEEKKGNVADINLLLAALCRHTGLEVSPVILSSRSHGFAVDDYPLLSDYNYVIVQARIDGDSYLLDASKPAVGFGQLPGLCYNGWARLIDSSVAQLPLFPDSVTDTRLTTVELANTDSGYTGRYARINGVFESMSIRNRMRKTKTEDFFESFRRTMPDYEQMGDYGFDSLDIPEAPLGWHYKMKYNFTQGTILFNPIFHERFANNLFASPVRHYPVEMPFCIDNTYLLTMDIPKGYRLDQLPKSQRVKLGDSEDGFFEYQISSDGATILFKLRLSIKRTSYSVGEYAAIRDFFAHIVSKEREPIVFKKID
jgi:hypothetical protein